MKYFCVRYDLRHEAKFTDSRYDSTGSLPVKLNLPILISNEISSYIFMIGMVEEAYHTSI